jgi:hypothetical protein
VEQLQEHFHRRFVEALVRLADICSREGRKEDVVDVLVRAITAEALGEYIRVRP